MSILKHALIPLVFTFLGALVVYFIPLDIQNYTQAFTLAAGLFLAVALFGNVQSIDMAFLKENRLNAGLIVSFGVFLKVILLGALLYFFTDDKVYFLIAAVISQIDPSFTNWTQRLLNIRGQAAKLSIIESTFDDPISVLLSLYLILPFIVPGGLEFGYYLFFIILNFIFVLVFIFEERRAKIHSSFLSSSSVVVGGLLNLFLGVALSGLIFRVKKEIFDEPINIISYLSYFLIGTFIDLTSVQWIEGLIVALTLVYFVRPVEVFLLFNRLPIKEKMILIFAEQKG
jgi:hypothetical protein